MSAVHSGFRALQNSMQRSRPLGFVVPSPKIPVVNGQRTGPQTTTELSEAKAEVLLAWDIVLMQSVTLTNHSSPDAASSGKLPEMQPFS